MFTTFAISCRRGSSDWPLNQHDKEKWLQLENLKGGKTLKPFLL